jgi:hypothetical protein
MICSGSVFGSVLDMLFGSWKDLTTGSLVLSDGRTGPASVRSLFRHVTVSVDRADLGRSGWLGWLRLVRSIGLILVVLVDRDDYMLT